MIRILLADDHAVIREGVKQILAEALPNPVFGEARTAEEVQTQIRTQAWDIIVLDMSLPGNTGLGTIHAIRRLHPTLQTLVYSMHADSRLIKLAFQAGVRGYLSKQGPLDELVKAIQQIQQGRRYIPSDQEGNLTGSASVEDTDKPVHETLSSRERQILRLIASGKKTTEIAAELGLSVPTVSTYRKRVLEKMGMTTNAELTRYAINYRLLE